MKKLYEVTDKDKMIDFMHELGVRTDGQLSDICYNALCVFIDKEKERHIVFNNVGNIRNTDELYDAFFKVLNNAYNDFYINKFKTATEINILFNCKNNKKFSNGSKYYMLSTKRQKSKEIKTDKEVEQLFIDSLTIETKSFPDSVNTFVIEYRYDKEGNIYYKTIQAVQDNTKIESQATDEYIHSNYSSMKNLSNLKKAYAVKLIVFSTTDNIEESGKKYYIEDLELPPKDNSDK